jgi:hypothetical protein
LLYFAFRLPLLADFFDRLPLLGRFLLLLFFAVFFLPAIFFFRAGFFTSFVNVCCADSTFDLIVPSVDPIDSATVSKKDEGSPDESCFCVIPAPVLPDIVCIPSGLDER